MDEEFCRQQKLRYQISDDEFNYWLVDQAQAELYEKQHPVRTAARSVGIFLLNALGFLVLLAVLGVLYAFFGIGPWDIGGDPGESF